MAKNEKKSSGGFNAQRDAQAKEAKKKLKEAEKAGAGAKKNKAEKADKKKSTVKFRRFWKDFRGELKKIVWPDFKTVLKNTGIVLLTTVIIGIPVWILDYALTEGILGLKKMAQGAQTEVATTTPGLDLDGLSDYLTEPAGEQTAEATTAPAAETEQPDEQAQ